jgi:hypothetical protein
MKFPFVSLLLRAHCSRRNFKKHRFQRSESLQHRPLWLLKKKRSSMNWISIDRKHFDKYVACFFFLSTIFYSSYSVAQRKSKDYEVVTQKGVLFLSWNNIHYIDSINKHSIDVLYTPDIFLPIKEMDTASSIAKSFFSENLRTGVEILYLNARSDYLQKAQSYKNDSVGTPCYTEKGYSLLPVCIKYKQWKKYPNILVCHAPVVVYLNGRKVSFRYSTPSVEVLEITLLSSANK